MSNRGEQFLAGRLFKKNERGPSANRVRREVGIVMHRQHDDLALEAARSSDGLSTSRPLRWGMERSVMITPGEAVAPLR